MDGQECLSSAPSYLFFLVSNSIHAYITKFEQVIFGPSGWGALGATDLKGLTSKTFWIPFGQTEPQPLGHTEASNWSKFSISVWPSWTISEPPMCLTASQLHVSVPPSFSIRSHRQRMGIYFCEPEALVLSPTPRSRTPSLPSPESLDVTLCLQCLSVAGFRRRQRQSIRSLPP
jgi:hypothetical protein